jgi:hypothetical protein
MMRLLVAAAASAAASGAASAAASAAASGAASGAASAALTPPPGARGWPDLAPMVSYWYAVDNDWPAAVALITPYVTATPAVVTSIMSYCGLDVSDAGAIVNVTSAACLDFFAALRPLGVRPEIMLNAGNCSIDAYRTLWADKTVSPAVILSAAVASGAVGVGVDFEPQADNCQGGPTGTAADAAAYAGWLAAVRAALAPAGIRLTVDVASWSPVLNAAVLAPAVDRALTMETYNGGSEAEWLEYYSAFLASVPRDKAGVGLGAWDDGKGAWWETPAGAAAKVARAAADGVPELAVFRILPQSGQSASWPLPFWWGPLQAYANGTWHRRAA